MKVKVGEYIFNANETPIMLIFESDAERVKTAENLMNMEPKNGIRKYVMFPDTQPPEEIQEFMKTSHIEVDENLPPFYVHNIFDLPQFRYSDTKERITVGDLVRWVYKVFDEPIELPNGGICTCELILINWENH